MRKIQSVGLLGFFFLSAAWCSAGESPWDRQLPFETATVDYTVSGTMKGQKTIYVKDFGRTTAEYSSVTLKMMGMTQKQEEIIITTPDFVYSADLAQGTGTKQLNPQKCMTDEYNRLSVKERKKVIKNSEAMGVQIMDGMGGTVEKKAATLLGYACDRVTLMGTTAHTISGSALPLKIQGNVMGIKISQVATDLKTGRAPASKFELPKGISFETDPETDRMIREQARSAIQNLLAGKNPADGSSESLPAAADDTARARDEGGDVLEEDARDVGEAAHQEAKEATMDEVREGVQNVFKGLFN